MELTWSAVSGIPKKGNAVRSSIRGVVSSSAIGRIESPSLNPNGKRTATASVGDIINHMSIDRKACAHCKTTQWSIKHYSPNSRYLNT